MIAVELESIELSNVKEKGDRWIAYLRRSDNG